MKTRVILMAISLVLLMSQVPALAETDMDAKEIMRQVELQNSAVDEVLDITMTLVDADGRERSRTATLYIKQKSGMDDMRLIRFHTPADIAKSAVLTIENSDRDNDQWVYLPAYHTTRRIATANRSDNYMGTDFAYEDITDPRIDEYQYAIVRQEKYREIECVIIESIPTAEKLVNETAYSKTVSWIDPGKFVTLKQEFYDKKGELLKVLTNLELEQYGEKYRWQQTEMENVQTQHKTINEVTKREINTGLSDNIFTQRYLKRGR